MVSFDGMEIAKSCSHSKDDGFPPRSRHTVSALHYILIVKSLNGTPYRSSLNIQDICEVGISNPVRFLPSGPTSTNHTAHDNGPAGERRVSRRRLQTLSISRTRVPVDV
jgi:hypothetical protein